ncbi:kinase-like domain-containing protein [Mycena rebaudengoi]|nr:kinase-like domain-containing protein [Mycena rebaudengoi]
MPDVAESLIQICVSPRDNESIIDGNSEPNELEAAPLQNETGEKTSSGEETTFGEKSLQDFHGRDLKGRIKQDDQYPFTGGVFSHLAVAIKMIRMSDDGSQQEEMLRRLKREVDVWSRLKHKNILPFIGVCDDLAPLPVLISPFLKFGNIGRYLSKHPAAKREELFLHAKNIIYGDLKVQNVLVDKRGVPCICDFGVSKIVSRRGLTTSNVGTAPYMAPELWFVIDGVGTSRQESAYPSVIKSSDVYSFALLVLEILTSEPPKGRPTRPIVTAKILAELRPKRADYDENTVQDRTWSVLDRCWSFEPQLRPTVSEVLRDLADGFT